MMKCVYILGIFLVILALGFFLVPAKKADYSDLIHITSPVSNQIVTSPLTVTGEARGNWYFEASFPVKILDANGALIVQSHAEAQGDWMTTDFVPFIALLEFSKPGTQTGTLVLEKDNPSGLPENAAEVRIPIRFTASSTLEDTMTVEAYFGNSSLAITNGMDCTELFPVERVVPKTMAVARAALEELFKGPTDAEKSNGFFTSINPGVMIQKVSIENGVASVDLSEELERAVGGSCRVAAIRAQITATVKQFPTVTDVVISISGRTEDILQP